MPWWHVANVPFQVVCVFLAMDVRESLSRVGTAMRVLEEVVERFQTVAMKEALKTARFLVRLSKKRKDEDSEVLGLSLKKGVDSDPQPENLEPPPVNGNGGGGGRGSIGAVVIEAGEDMPTTTSSSSVDDWTMELANNSDFDWNFFLTADMPALDNFAPDGNM